MNFLSHSSSSCACFISQVNHVISTDGKNLFSRLHYLGSENNNEGLGFLYVHSVSHNLRFAYHYVWLVGHKMKILDDLVRSHMPEYFKATHFKIKVY